MLSWFNLVIQSKLPIGLA